MASGNDPPQLPRGLIGRTGTPSAKGARLPSIRGPRDLTLGGIQKKVFTPTIPAKRNKASESGEQASSKPDDSKSNRPQSGGHGGRGRGGDRGRGRGAGRGRGSNVIQTHSLFEQGPAEKAYKPSSGGGEYASSGAKSSSSSTSGGPKFAVKREKGDSDTKEVIDNLLRDDFISGHRDPDEDDITLLPVKLPLEVKSEVKKEVEDYTKVKVKSEPMETDDNGSKVGDDKTQVFSSKSDKEKETTCSELFSESAIKSATGELLFFQLPDTLPGLPLTTDEEFKAKKPTDKKDGDQSEELTKKLGGCNLDSFNEGLIGKLIVRKSGKVQLMLGTTYLDVNMGTPCSFLQDVASVRLDGDHGDISILGHIEHKLVCTPDFETLLDNT